MATKASFSAVEIANAFIELANSNGVKMSNMQLQKLVYIAFGYFAALMNKRLFDDDIEAWYFGPVIPNLYHRLKKYGLDVITQPISTETEVDTDSSEWKIVEAVWESYDKYTAEELSNLTHQEGTPWSNVYKEGAKHIKIPFHLIRQYYEHLLRGKMRAEKV